MYGLPRCLHVQKKEASRARQAGDFFLPYVCMYIRARSHTGPAAHRSLRPRRTRLGFGVAAPPATKLLLHAGVVVFCDNSPFARECMQRVVVVFCNTSPFALECMQRGVRGMPKVWSPPHLTKQVLWWSLPLLISGWLRSFSSTSGQQII